MQQAVEYQLFHFASIFGASVGIASAGFTLLFSIEKGITKILLKITRKKKKKYDKILMLVKSKLKSIEKLISKTLNDMK